MLCYRDISTSGRYRYQRLKASNVDLIVLPFQCDYVGNETDAVFNAYYAALNEYLQGTLNVDANGKTTIKIPTLETQYEYNNAIYNIGGWMYSQIKKNHLGVLSSDRVNKLKKVSISKFNYDSYGNVINANNVRFNVLDRDSYLNQALYDKLCYTNYDFYNNEYPSMKFNNDGVLDENGKNILCFRSNEYRIRKQHITTKNYIYDIPRHLNIPSFGILSNNFIIREVNVECLWSFFLKNFLTELSLYLLR